MYTTLMVVVEAYTELTVVYGGGGGIDSIDGGEDIYMYSSNGGGGDIYSIDGGGGGKGDIHAQFSFVKYVSCEQTR